MAFKYPEKDIGRVALSLRQQGLAISCDGIYGPKGGTRLFKARFQNGRNLDLHFKQLTPKINDSWEKGCMQKGMSLLSVRLCFWCQHTTTSRHLQFCQAETGNFNIMKVWSNPIQLPQTRPKFGVSFGTALAYNNIRGARKAPKRVY
mmetsp:Transcript_50183/g.96893  ORF Transcript_50183/g.96893 Transcript_50183/m.96893 type:complete len:147 (+) Transcript_50183:2-442(+)